MSDEPMTQAQLMALVKAAATADALRDLNAKHPPEQLARDQAIDFASNLAPHEVMQ